MSMLPCRCACCRRHAELLNKQLEYQAASAPAAAVGGDALYALHAEGAYLIKYDDQDEMDELFAGPSAREMALRRYADRSLAWNAHLFAKIDSNSRDCKTPNATPAAPVGGFVVVPREPTDAMLREGRDRIPKEGEQRSSLDYARYIYTAMIAASPAAQPSAKDGVRESVTDSFASEVAMAVHLAGYPLVAASVVREIISTANKEATTAAGLVDGAIADLFWNDADNEIAYRSIAELVNRQWEGGNVQDGTLLTIQRAQSMATITIRLSVPDEYPDGDTEITWEAAIGREVAK